MGQAGDFTKAEISAEMLEAGRDAFLRWFRQDRVGDCFNSLPEDQDLSSLSSAIFDSMIRLRPDNSKNIFSRSLIS